MSRSITAGQEQPLKAHEQPVASIQGPSIYCSKAEKRENDSVLPGKARLDANNPFQPRQAIGEGHGVEAGDNLQPRKRVSPPSKLRIASSNTPIWGLHLLHKLLVRVNEK